jgi:hypothetical protein
MMAARIGQNWVLQLELRDLREKQALRALRVIRA